MRSGEGREAIARGPNKFRHAACRAAAQSQDADRQCEQILDAMVHLPEQKLLSLARAFELCDVPGDFRGANDLAFFILIGETVMEISTRLPSLRCRTVS
jgi:hypothetical protein